MIDFVKIKVLQPDISNIRNHPLLEWFQNTNEQTGEIKEVTTDYQGLRFKIIVNKYFYISGSIHKHWNSLHRRGGQNYNDFRFIDLVETIILFCKTFDLTPSSCKLENLEFGVNISPRISANEILRSAINHKGKPFTREYSETKRFRECEHQRYIIKIYNKGLQYNQLGNILRFENKTIKMIHLKRAGIQTLSDLMNPVKVVRLGTILRYNFNDILFYDHTIQENGLSASERLILTQGQTPEYWVDLQERNPNNYHKKRNRFKGLVKKNGNQDIQEIVGCSISKKWYELLQCDHKTLRELTGRSNSNITVINHSDKGLKLVNYKYPD